MERDKQVAKLKPCPFCGGNKIKLVYNILSGPSLNCQGCGVVVKHGIYPEKAWNRREE